MKSWLLSAMQAPLVVTIESQISQFAYVLENLVIKVEPIHIRP